ncbi:CPBP family intramembrane metalloprotease [Candidatus Poribacteria bacterium]|nr:CPBP family intramembrane metalloprotease [Candidatus Poribacteria bacterium]MBT5712203.1 CPBP family intramembrane metalloprotease [Candidatus Poribacteria bacterium]MBT7100977.1 CPBP family intramembrane metalloprotease [Candidatus Poribacteria bacterium]MBT7809462.1 CPBP family intramembrane metalloprotease [Candidatus Poribacteria bacterium]
MYFVALAGRQEAGFAYAVGKVAQFGLPVVWLRWVEGRWPRPTAPRGQGSGSATLFGVAVLGVLLALYFGAMRSSPMLVGAAARLRERLEPMGVATPVGFLCVAVFYCIAHSLLEEYYWRWFIFGRLREQSAPLLAGVVSSVAFTGHHVILVGRLTGGSWGAAALLSLCVAVGGAAWAWMYQRSGSLYGPWWSHGLVDAGLMVVGYDLLWPFP